MTYYVDRGGIVPNIIVSEIMNTDGLQALANLGDLHYDPDLWRDSVNLSRWVSEADAMVVRNQTHVTAELISRGPNLKVIGRLGVGLDNIDLRAAQEKGVVVVTAQGANAVAVAEYVFATLFYFSRSLHTVDDSVRRGRWDRTQGGVELYGKTLGLIGMGDIGQRIAFRARAFNMAVIAYDPWRLATNIAAMELGAKLVSLNEVLENSDFISVHVPLTEATRGLVDHTALRRIRSSAYLINTARGGVVDEPALLAAIENGGLAGAALDVRNVEPIEAGDRLIAEKRILLTPHIAGLTEEAGRRTAMTVVDDVSRVLNGQAPLAAV